MLMPSEVSVRERASVLVKRFYAHARRFESATSHISSDYLLTIEHHFEEAVSLGLLPELADIPFGKKMDIAVGYQTEHYVRDFQEILVDVDTSPDLLDAKTYIPGEFNAESRFIPIFYDYAGPVFDPDRMAYIAAGFEGVAVAIESRLENKPKPFDKSLEDHFQRFRKNWSKQSEWIQCGIVHYVNQKPDNGNRSREESAKELHQKNLGTLPPSMSEEALTKQFGRKLGNLEEVYRRQRTSSFTSSPVEFCDFMIQFLAWKDQK
ncbi:MAG: hypothetical protein ACK5PB_14065 [Pirellula sp.]|jgi:hypothetical protein